MIGMSYHTINIHIKTKCLNRKPVSKTMTRKQKPKGRGTLASDTTSFLFVRSSCVSQVFVHLCYRSYNHRFKDEGTPLNAQLMDINAKC